jgi:hypothetical protein
MHGTCLLFLGVRWTLEQMMMCNLLPLTALIWPVGVPSCFTVTLGSSAVVNPEKLSTSRLQGSDLSRKCAIVELVVCRKSDSTGEQLVKLCLICVHFIGSLTLYPTVY